LAEELLSRDYAVHVLDDLSTGSVENVRHLRDRRHFECTVGSCCDQQLVGRLVAQADRVYHLAAAVGVRLVIGNPVQSIDTNVNSTQTVLAHASERQRPVLLVSTSEVYGKSTVLPFREDGDIVICSPDRARWAYAHQDRHPVEVRDRLDPLPRGVRRGL
jgi:UDP-glucose 4-epimerase